MTQRIVIVGGGQAGFAFAEQIRRKDNESDVVIVCAEDELPYQRPPLSKQYVKSEIPKAKLFFRDADWFDRKSIRVILNSSVAQIDRSARHIVLTNGETIAYDKLLIATGSTPRRLPESMGGNLPNVMTIRDIKDADQFAANVGPSKRVLIVGGGYIGLEAAAVARSFDCDVRVLEMSERILQRVACDETSTFFRGLHQSHGVEISEGLALSHLDGNATGVRQAHFGDGNSLDVDVVIVGIGIDPNTTLATAAGLHTNNGIAVSNQTQTSDPAIYSAGDCASFRWRGQNIRLESVQNAVDQAKTAARHACGETVGYDPMPWFWSDQYNVKLQIAGLNTGYDSVVRREGVRAGGESFWYFKGETLLALDAMNDAKTYVMGRKLLELGLQVSKEQVADSTLDLKQIINGGG